VLFVPDVRVCERGDNILSTGYVEPYVQGLAQGTVPLDFRRANALVIAIHSYAPFNVTARSLF